MVLSSHICNQECLSFETFSGWRPMHSALTENLYAAFPQLYRGRYKPQSESAMCWGFECGDGWYQMLYDLSQELSKYQAAHPTLNLEVVQVKSKLGILRVHLNCRDAAIEKMIEPHPTAC